MNWHGTPTDKNSVWKTRAFSTSWAWSRLLRGSWHGRFPSQGFQILQSSWRICDTSWHVAHLCDTLQHCPPICCQSSYRTFNWRFATLYDKETLLVAEGSRSDQPVLPCRDRSPLLAKHLGSWGERNFCSTLRSPEGHSRRNAAFILIRSWARAPVVRRFRDSTRSWGRTLNKVRWTISRLQYRNGCMCVVLALQIHPLASHSAIEWVSQRNAEAVSKLASLFPTGQKAGGLGRGWVGFLRGPEGARMLAERQTIDRATDKAWIKTTKKKNCGNHKAKTIREGRKAGACCRESLRDEREREGQQSRENNEN